MALRRLDPSAQHPYHPLVVLGRLEYDGPDLKGPCEALLTHANPLVRQTALRLLVRGVDDPRVGQKAALQLAADPDDRVRMYAAYVLATLGHDVSVRVRSIAECLEREDRMTRAWALEYLQQLGARAKQALPAIRSMRSAGDDQLAEKKRLAIQRISSG